MSYGEEIATERMIDAEIAYQQHVTRVMKGIWTTKNGRRISIRDMTESHINNCIRMLSTQENDIAEMWIRRFTEELEERKGR